MVNSKNLQKYATPVRLHVPSYWLINLSKCQPSLLSTRFPKILTPDTLLLFYFWYCHANTVRDIPQFYLTMIKKSFCLHKATSQSKTFQIPFSVESPYTVYVSRCLDFRNLKRRPDILTKGRLKYNTLE